MAFAHATCLVAGGETHGHGRDFREFWLTAGQNDWVEVDFERREAPRSTPYTLPRLLVFRGPLGELLGQEFLADFDDADALLALQARCDALRAAEDAALWTPERRQAIEEAQRALEDTLYATPFHREVIVVSLAAQASATLGADFDALHLPHGRFIDASVRPPVADPAALRPG